MQLVVKQQRAGCTATMGHSLGGLQDGRGCHHLGKGQVLVCSPQSRVDSVYAVYGKPGVRTGNRSGT